MELALFCGVIPGSIGLAVSLIGVRRSGRPGFDLVGASTIALILACATVYAATQHAPNADSRRFIGGLVLAALLGGAAPATAYYGLGRGLARHRVWLGILWAASLVPLFLYMVIVLVWVLDLVTCPPGASGCVSLG
jgi:hypothetical protein